MSELMTMRPADTLAAAARVQDVYSDHFKDFVSFVQERSADFSYDVVREYFTHLNGTAYSANTKRVRRQAVKARLRLMTRTMDWSEQAAAEAAMKALDHDADTKAPKINSVAVPEEKVVTQDQFDLLVSKTSRRTSLFLWMLYNTGLRVSEMCGIRLDKCVDLGDMVRLTIVGKGNKERKVEIERTLFNDIRAAFNGTTYLFETEGGRSYQRTYVSGEIRKAGLRILGRKIGAHCMRHSFATLTIRSGASIKAVSSYLGHSSTSITLDMYTHETLKKSEMIRRPYRPVVAA